MAAWVAAIGTWVAAIGTVGTLIALILQRRSDKRQARTETRLEQARRISALVGPEEGTQSSGRTPFFLLNRSEEPVYNLVATIVMVQGAAPHRGEDWAKEQVRPVPQTTISVLPPGKWRIWINGGRWAGTMALRASAEVAFTDRAGVHWIRRGTGELEELSKAPFEYFKEFGLYGPYDLVTPESID